MTNTPHKSKLNETELAKTLQDFILNNRRLRDLKGLSIDDMEAIYATGYNLYNGGRYTDAEKIFECLCMLDHMEHRFWMGLGSTRQVLKKYQLAIDAYSMATMLDVFKPEAALQAAECHLALGNIQGAKSALECTIQYSGSNKEIKERAESLLALLEKQPA